MKIYQAVFCCDTLGFFISYNKAQSIIISSAKRTYENVWTEEALYEWIEDFLKNGYDDWNETYIAEEEVDMEDY
jgi:hypothetical protein